ncbi:MAG: hypothetical protein WCB10_17840 [Steroidobacteraceae bacterium]
MHFPQTFEAFLKLQQIDPQALPAEAEVVFRREYERAKAEAGKHDVRYMSSKPCQAGQFRYAVAIEDGATLWLTLWVKRNSRGESFILYPRGNGSWNPHASYHRDGTYHQKSHNLKSMVQKRQPLDQFTGAEHLGTFYGHGTGAAICDPAAFTSVLTIPAGILERTRGCVLVDLVEPGATPAAHHRSVPGLNVVAEETYRDCSPWVVVAVAEQDTGLNRGFGGTR